MANSIYFFSFPSFYVTLVTVAEKRQQERGGGREREREQETENEKTASHNRCFSCSIAQLLSVSLSFISD